MSLANHFTSQSACIVLNTDHLELFEDLGHPYVRNYSIGQDFSWVLLMSPLMSKLFSSTDCVVLDVTFQASVDLQYLMNVVTFNYDTLRCRYHIIIRASYTHCTYTLFMGAFFNVGHVVARVYLDKITAEALTTVLREVFDQVKLDHSSFIVGETLKDILVDWSDTQLKALRAVLGDEIVDKVTKGCQVCTIIYISLYVCPCSSYLRTFVWLLTQRLIYSQVHYMRSVKRVAERVNKGSRGGYQAFVSIGYAIPPVKSKDDVMKLFQVLCGKEYSRTNLGPFQCCD